MFSEFYICSCFIAVVVYVMLPYHRFIVAPVSDILMETGYHGEFWRRPGDNSNTCLVCYAAG